MRFEAHFFRQSTIASHRNRQRRHPSSPHPHPAITARLFILYIIGIILRESQIKFYAKNIIQVF